MTHPSLSQTNNANYGAVRRLQNALREAGYSTPVDAHFSLKTHNAVVAFQTAAGLTANGVVNGATWLALEQDPAPSPAKRAVKKRAKPKPRR